MQYEYKRSGGVIIPVITPDMTPEEAQAFISHYGQLSQQERWRIYFGLYLKDRRAGDLSDYTQEEIENLEAVRQEWEKGFAKTTEYWKKVSRKAELPHEAMQPIRDALQQPDNLTNERLQQLDQQAQGVIDSVMLSVEQRDSGYNTINTSPVARALIKGESKAVFLGENPESGERAVFTLLSGYMEPYEIEITEDIAKFKLDGQVTEKGKIWFTIGQLYRAMRHGAGTDTPSKEQRDALYKRLEAMADLDRRIEYRINDYLKTYGGFETNGGKFRIIGYDEFYGRIRGQEDTLIVMDETPVINQVAENLKMREIIPQEVKAIKQARYLVEFKQPIMIKGKPVKSRSFSTAAERDKYCRDNGITVNDIAEYREKVTPWKLTENRISIRSLLTNFVYGYIRARAAGNFYSNKLPYSEIFTRCSVNESSREIVKRTKNDIAVIMDHLTRTIPELKSWKTYTNAGSTKPDGVEITLSLPEITGGV